MHKSEKERVVAELTERLSSSQALIVADYRGLTNSELESLRGELTKHGARFAVVKNTLTRRAAEAAGADALLALLEGPTAIAFIESDGDPVAVAKALGQTARTTRILAVRGGLLEGRSMSADEIETLAKLPPLDVLRGQVVGAVTAPLYAIVGLFTAPLQNLHGLVQARIEQLEAGGDTSAAEAAAEPESPGEPAPQASTAEAAGPGETETTGEATAEPEASADAGTTETDATAEAAADEQPDSPAADPTESVAADAEAQGSDTDD